MEIATFQDVSEPNNYAECFYAVFTSGIEDQISNFNGTFFFAPRSEVAAYYRGLDE